MMGEMLDLVEVAGVDQDEAEQPAENLVEPLGLEHGRMAEFMLAGVKEIDQYPMRDEGRDRQPAAPCQAERRARQHERAEMGADLQRRRANPI